MPFLRLCIPELPDSRQASGSALPQTCSACLAARMGTAVVLCLGRSGLHASKGQSTGTVIISMIEQHKIWKLSMCCRSSLNERAPVGYDARQSAYLLWPSSCPPPACEHCQRLRPRDPYSKTDLAESQPQILAHSLLQCQNTCQAATPALEAKQSAFDNVS